MSLLHPEFILALAALAIPIVIHLFNFRRFKKVIFPNVRFLKEVDLRTRSKNRLKHLLVLLSRMLALAALVLAFSRPFIPLNDGEKVVKERHVAVYLDNSFSMDLENDGGTLLSQGLSIAEKIGDSYGPNDRFMLLTNDLKPEHQRLLSADEFKEQLSAIGQSTASRSYSEIYARAADVLDKGAADGRDLFYLSDFQERSFDPINATEDTLINSRIVKLSHSGQGNVYIDSIWFESPLRSVHLPERLGVRVVNASGKELYDVPVRLSIDGVQKAIGNMTIKPYTSVDSVLTFSNDSPGWKKGKVSISDHPITFDDVLHFSYQVRESCNVLIIGEGKPADRVSRVFKNDPFYALETTALRQVDLSKLSTTDFVILPGLNDISNGLVRALSKFVAEGGSLCVIPAADAKQSSLNELFLALGANTISTQREQAVKVASLDLEHPIYLDVFDQKPRNVDLPTCNRFYAFNTRVQSTEERIMSLQGGASLLSAYTLSKGVSYVFSTDLEPSQSSLGSHYLFVTAMLRMAEMSAGSPEIYHTIGRDEQVALRIGELPADGIFEFSPTELGSAFIPEQRSQGAEMLFYDRGQVKDASTYSVTAEGKQKAFVSYNYDRKESEMQFMDETAIRSELERNGSLNTTFLDAAELNSGDITKAVAGTALWRYFIIAALLFLALEVLLLKYWK